MRSAYLDIGTNSIRYLAVEPEPAGAFHILARGLETPRLGAGAKEGKLAPAALARALESLSTIVELMRKLGVSRFRAVGTEALRRAPNRDVFLRGAAELGLAVEVASGAREAALVRRGVLAGNPALLPGPSWSISAAGAPSSSGRPALSAFPWAASPSWKPAARKRPVPAGASANCSGCSRRSLHGSRSIWSGWGEPSPPWLR